MELLLFLAGWYGTGLIGSVLLLGVWWREDLDVKVNDVLIGMFMSWFGPFNLIIGLLFSGCTLIKRACRRAGFAGDGVVWSRRK